MNEQQPYEKHLGDKLQQLTQPGDANRHWPKMKSLLDRELPEGGGGNGRPGRWWMYGIIAGILLTGAWFGTAFFSNEKKDQVLTGPTATTNKTKETTASSAVSLPSSPEDQTGSNVPGLITKRKLIRSRLILLIYRVLIILTFQKKIKIIPQRRK